MPSLKSRKEMDAEIDAEIAALKKLKSKEKEHLRGHRTAAESVVPSSRIFQVNNVRRAVDRRHREKRAIRYTNVEIKMRKKKIEQSNAEVLEKQRLLDELEVERRNREQAIRDGIADIPNPWLSAFRRVEHRDDIKDIEIGRALTQTFGIITHAARILGVESSWLRKRVDDSELLRSIRDELRECLLDFTEGKLVNAITNNQPWAIVFYLNAQGKTRGYASDGSTPSDGGMISGLLDRIANESAARIADMRTTPDTEVRE